MATKPLPIQQPESNWTPPRGIAYMKERPGRPLPFGLQWRANGKREFQFFKDEAGREDAAKKLAKERAKHGQSILTFTADGWAEYREAKALAKGRDLRDVVAEWLPKSSLAHSWPTDKAVDEYLKLRIGVDIQKDSSTSTHLELHLKKRFALHFKSTPLDNISPPEVRHFLAGILSSKTGLPIVNRSRNHHRKDINAFFKRAILEGWCTKNPCVAVTPAMVPVKDKVPFTIEEVKRLLLANLYEPVIGRIALELFGGLRASSVKRLKKEHVDFEDRGIRLLGYVEKDGQTVINHKSRKTLYRQGHPDVLWKWLEHCGDNMWTDIDEGNYVYQKQLAFARAGLGKSENRCRVSFASYYIAFTGHLGGASQLMQHSTTKTTCIYEGVAKQKAAKLYFEQTPQAVKQLLEVGQLADGNPIGLPALVGENPVLGDLPVAPADVSAEPRAEVS